MKVFLVVDVQSFFNFFVLLSNAESNANSVKCFCYAGAGAVFRISPLLHAQFVLTFFPLSLPAFLLFLIIFGGVFWVT